MKKIYGIFEAPAADPWYSDLVEVFNSRFEAEREAARLALTRPHNTYEVYEEPA